MESRRAPLGYRRVAATAVDAAAGSVHVSALALPSTPARPRARLLVAPLGESETYEVRGGAAPHRVDFRCQPAACDCAAAQYRPGTVCKHVHAVWMFRSTSLGVKPANALERDTLSAPNPPTNGRSLTHIRDLLAEPDDPVSWIVDGLLPAGGLSVLAGKPKGGKSTLARAIALRVSRGEPALGRGTIGGPVIYLGLEDPRRITKGHLQTLGAREDDDLWVFTGTRPDQAMLWLREKLEEVDPVLVVVDTLQQLLGVADLNDYAQVVTALAPLLGLVRPRRAHLLLVHHAGKGERTGFDAVLGSTALVGTADVVLLLRRREDHTRTLATLQRMGTDLPETVLDLDLQKEPQLGLERRDHDAEQAGERIVGWLRTQSEPMTRAAILEGVEGRAEMVGGALLRLVESGRVTRTGRGRKGDPFLFRDSPYTPGIAESNPETVNSGRDTGTNSIPAVLPFRDGLSISGNRILDPDAEAQAATRDGA